MVMIAYNKPILKRFKSFKCFFVTCTITIRVQGDDLKAGQRQSLKVVVDGQEAQANT